MRWLGLFGANERAATDRPLLDLSKRAPPRPGSTQQRSIRGTFRQVAHGFAAGTCICFVSGTWTEADPTDPDSHWSQGVVETVHSADRFTVVFFGVIRIAGTPGTYNYLAASGGYTDTPATQYQQPVFIQITDTEGFVVHRPSSGLIDLFDVELTGVADGDILVYDFASSKWVNEAPAGGGATDLESLTDVDLTTPLEWDFLRYDGTQWENFSLGSIQYDPATNTLALGTSADPMKVGIPDGGRLIVAETAPLEWVLSGDPDTDTEVTAKIITDGAGSISFYDQGDSTGGTSGTKVMHWECDATAGNRFFRYDIPLRVRHADGLYLERDSTPTESFQIHFTGSNLTAFKINSGTVVEFDTSSVGQINLAWKTRIQGVMCEVVGGYFKINDDIESTGKINAASFFECGFNAGLGIPGLPQVVTLAKLTAGGANGSLTITGGIVTAYTAPT